MSGRHDLTRGNLASRINGFGPSQRERAQGITMINLPIGTPAASSSLRNGIPSQDSTSSPQSNLDLKSRNAEIEERPSRQTGGIASLVQLNLSVEEAFAQAQQIKAQLLAELFSIANEDPQDIAALLR